MSVLSNLRATLLNQATVMTPDLGGPLYAVERGTFTGSDPVDTIADEMIRGNIRDLTGQLSMCGSVGGVSRDGQTGHSGANGPSTRHILTRWAFAYAIGSERDNASTGGIEIIDSAAFERWNLSVNYRLLTGLQSPGPPTGWSYWYPEMDGEAQPLRTENLFIRVIYFTVRCDSSCT